VELVLGEPAIPVEVEFPEKFGGAGDLLGADDLVAIGIEG